MGVSIASVLKPTKNVLKTVASLYDAARRGGMPVDVRDTRGGKRVRYVMCSTAELNKRSGKVTFIPFRTLEGDAAEDGEDEE